MKKRTFSIFYLVTCLAVVLIPESAFGKNSAKFNEINKLTCDNTEYYYSSTVSVGGSVNIIRGLFTNVDKSNDLIESVRSPLCELSGIEYTFLAAAGINLSYNVLFSSPFFARRLGIFPRLGISLNLIGQNILTRFIVYFLPNVGICLTNGVLRIIKFFGENANKICCCCVKQELEFQVERLKYKKTFLSRPSGIFNLQLTIEPETDIHETFKAIPQIGFGPSLVFLSRNTKAELFPSDQENFEKNNNEILYKNIFDIVFGFKMIFKFAVDKNFKNSIHLELGYTYNPLILASLSGNTENSIVEGGLWNMALSLNYARNINIGLETVDFLNPELKTSTELTDNKLKKQEPNNTFFIDLGIGIGKWTNISSSEEISTTYCPNINISIFFPYIGTKLSKYHYLSFVGFDINEDLRTGPYHNKDHNFLWALVNNLTVNYNFLTLMSDYNGIKFVHKLGIFLPFLTNLMSSLEHPAKGRFFSRSMISLENGSNFLDDDQWGKIIYGRISYKFRFYFDFLKLIGVNSKINNYFYFGLNTILLNRRLDYSCNGTNFNDFEFIKIESITFGISFKIN